MMPLPIRDNVSLQPYNTFGVEARARRFLSVQAPEMLAEAIAGVAHGRPFLTLGGGSNILFTRDFDGLVLKNDIRGVEVLERDDARVRVRVGGGEDWHGFVLWCLRQGLFGLENLALIPGTVGAAPVQNIGAYGVEVGDYIEAVDAIDLQDGSACRFDARACDFGYRDSIFKGRYRHRYFISAVTFRLSPTPRLVTSYADVRQALADKKRKVTTARDLCDIICDIRRRKLPDPEALPNAGSFFKNPVISREDYDRLTGRFPGLPAYPVDAGRTKVAAGWMIEKCGWKGRRIGSCGVYPHQALVLVNYGGASGREILSLAEAVQDAVADQFGIRLHPEPLIL